MCYDRIKCELRIVGKDHKEIESCVIVFNCVRHEQQQQQQT